MVRFMHFVTECFGILAEIDRARQRTVYLFGELYILRRILDAGFVELWVSWIGQDLIDPSPRHHVST